MEESRKAKNISNVERDDLNYFAENCMSQNIFSHMRVIDILNFVRGKSPYHDDYYLEITDNVSFNKNKNGEYVSKDNKLVLHDIDLDKFEIFVPDSFILREVQGFSIEMDERSIIMDLAD